MGSLISGNEMSPSWSTLGITCQFFCKGVSSQTVGMLPPPVSPREKVRMAALASLEPEVALFNLFPDC